MLEAKAGKTVNVFILPTVETSRAKMQAPTGVPKTAENNALHHKTDVFLCTSFTGTPKCDDKEMTLASFITLEELLENKDKMFKPFLNSLEVLVGYNEKLDSTSLTKENHKRTINSPNITEEHKDAHIPEDKVIYRKTEEGKTIAINPETGQVSGCGPEIDKSSERSKASELNKSSKGRTSKKPPVKRGKKPTLKLPPKEYGKVMHEIDTYFHRRFESREGKTCFMEVDKFVYIFDNNGYNNYNIHRKIRIVGNEELIQKIKEMYK